MLPKLTSLFQSKVAAAVLGVLLVGGSGGAVAVAATQGHLNGLGLQMGKSDSTETPDSGSKDGSHAEGMLTACDTTGKTIGVTDEHSKVYTFAVTSDTRFNGDTHGNNKGGNDSGGSSSASNTTFGLSDLCALVNKVKVQVQATASTSGSTTTYNADKITVEGPGTGGSGDNSGDDNGKPDSTKTPDAHHDFSGTVGTVNGKTFTMTVDGVQYTVDATNAKVEGALVAGAHVEVAGTLSGATITAWSVDVKSGAGSGTGGESTGGGAGSGTDD
jgi:hypothetical protein